MSGEDFDSKYANMGRIDYDAFIESMKRSMDEVSEDLAKKDKPSDSHGVTLEKAAEPMDLKKTKLDSSIVGLEAKSDFLADDTVVKPVRIRPGNNNDGAFGEEPDMSDARSVSQSQPQVQPQIRSQPQSQESVKDNIPVRAETLEKSKPVLEVSEAVSVPNKSSGETNSAPRDNPNIELSSENQNIKGIPREVSKFVVNKFPDAVNLKDAFLAYIYVNSDSQTALKPYMTKGALACASAYSSKTDDLESKLDRFHSELRSTNEAISLITNHIESIELAVGYIICKQIEALKKDVADPSKVDFLQYSVADLIKKLNDDTDVYHSRMKEKDGVNAYKNKFRK